MDIIRIKAEDRIWLKSFISEHWGEDKIVVHNKVYQPSRLPGFIALHGDQKLGVLTYSISEKQCEIVTIDSLFPGQGIGRQLIKSISKEAKKAGCHRLWLITTNDNLNALGFYQKMGFELVKIHRNALKKSRKLKPGIPLTGLNGIPLSDEIELEMML